MGTLLVPATHHSKPERFIARAASATSPCVPGVSSDTPAVAVAKSFGVASERAVSKGGGQCCKGENGRRVKACMLIKG